MKNLLLIVAMTMGIIFVKCGLDKSKIPNKNDYKNNNSKYEVATIDSLMAKNIKNFLEFYYLKDDLQYIPNEDRKYQFYKIDLNNDGKDEYFVRLMGNYFCGTGGCTFLLLDRYSKVITKFTVSNPPFYVFKQTYKGWNILSVFSNGENRLLKFDGKTYIPNPSLAPKCEIKDYIILKSLFNDKGLKSYTYYY